MKSIIGNPDFQAFLAGYTTALFWSSADEVDGETVNLDLYPVSTQAGDHCRADCLAFWQSNEADIRAAAAEYNNNDGFGYAGHDFALTRNGHGAGFWDGDLTEALGARLSAASKKAGECYAYVGDDYHVYIG